MKLFGTAGQAKLFCPGTKGQRDKLKILPRDGTGRDFLRLSRPVPGRPAGQNYHLFLHIYAVFREKFQKKKKFQKKFFLANFGHFLAIFWPFFGHFVPRDVPGQRVLSRDICSCPCPGTKGQRDKKKKFVPGQRDNGTSRPVETLV